MAIITFLSDYGNNDHYVSAVKAKIISHNPNLQIIDISHNIEHFNLIHGSFVLKSVFRDFPAGTIHLVAINESSTSRQIAIRLEDHFFIAADNGFLSLVSDKQADEIVELSASSFTFPAKAVMATAAARLATGESLQSLGTPVSEYCRLMNRQVRATKKQINGHVIHVDQYGNLITNIDKPTFEALNKNNDFTILVGREKFRKLNSTYTDTEAGDCFILFNHLGLLEIGINHGNANQLLGLDFDSPVNILFNEG